MLIGAVYWLSFKAQLQTLRLLLCSLVGRVVLVAALQGPYLSQCSHLAPFVSMLSCGNEGRWGADTPLTFAVYVSN